MGGFGDDIMNRIRTEALMLTQNAVYLYLFNPCSRSIFFGNKV